jgi:hypothetical protein
MRYALLLGLCYGIGTAGHAAPTDHGTATAAVSDDKSDEPKDESNLSGYWTCIDKKGDVSVVSVAKNKGGYLICWLKDGRSIQGCMDRDGDVLAVAWMEGPGTVGVSIYRLKGNTVHGPSESWHKLKVGGDV